MANNTFNVVSKIGNRTEMARSRPCLWEHPGLVLLHELRCIADGWRVGLLRTITSSVPVPRLCWIYRMYRTAGGSRNGVGKENRIGYACRQMK
jgi:hypothetical protein